MWKNHYLQTTFTINNVVNIQHAVGKNLVPSGRSYTL